MDVSLKSIKGLNVYEKDCSEPSGRIKGVCFSKDRNRIDAVLVETLSLIPLSKKFFMEEFGEICDKKVFLKDGVSVQSAKSKKEEDISEEKISGACCTGCNVQKISDMQFDFDTGEINCIILDNGIFKKKDKVKINKMHIKDNTIYIK